MVKYAMMIWNYYELFLLKSRHVFKLSIWTLVLNFALQTKVNSVRENDTLWSPVSNTLWNFLQNRLINKWYFLNKIVLTNCEKKIFLVTIFWEKLVPVTIFWETLLKFEAEGWEFAKFMRSLKQSRYSNREGWEQFLVTKCFSNLFLEISQI